MPPSMHEVFRCQIFFETQKGSPQIFFGNLRQKHFAKSVMPPPMNDIFDTRRFLKHRRVDLRIFLFLWEKNYSTQNRDIPLLCRYFSTPLFLTHWRVPHKMTRQSGTKYFRRKILIPFLLSINFFPYQKISDTQKCFLTKFFVSVVWDGKSLIKPWCPPPFPWIKIFGTRFFWSTEGFPNEFYRRCETKKVEQKAVIPPPPL